jgi:hypothetical protein
MPITDVEKKKYSEFIIRIIQLSKCLEFDRDMTVWHYTNGQSLLGIIESKRLYATQVSCLNGSTEVRYGSKLLRNALEGLVAKHSGDRVAEQFLTHAVTYFAEDPDLPGNVSLGFFVSCFSQLEDDLSQWRAYAGGENGYALGFRVRDLLATGGNHGFVCVSYDVNMHKSLAEQVAQATVDFYKDGLAADPSRTGEDWTKEFLQHWDTAVTFLAPLVKDPGFASEKEFRIIHPYVEGELKELKIAQKATLMASHLPLRIGNVDGHMPISAVKIGPCRHKGVTLVSVNAALQKEGFTGVRVDVSRIPFQQT